MNQHTYAARQAATYFQFPLCAFAYGQNERERLDAIFHFSIVEAGQKRWHQMRPEERHRFIENLLNGSFLPFDFDRTNESHCIAICGATALKLEIGSLKYCLAKHSVLERFIEAFQSRHGKDALVRLRTDLVIEATRGNGITQFELSLLAAIYSTIGRKQGPVRITQDRICCRALGYKSKSVMAAELSKRKDGAKPDARPFSDWMVRTRIEMLRQRRFFARCTYAHRQAYYSHRMTEKQLRHAVYEKKTRTFANKSLHQLDNQAMTDAIRNQRATFRGRPPAVPDALPFSIGDTVSIEDVSR